LILMPKSILLPMAWKITQISKYLLYTNSYPYLPICTNAGTIADIVQRSAVRSLVAFEDGSLNKNWKNSSLADLYKTVSLPSYAPELLVIWLIWVLSGMES
jgi:hypothetical protein